MRGGRYSGNEHWSRDGEGNPCEYIDGPLTTGLHAHIHPIAWGSLLDTIQYKELFISWVLGHQEEKFCVQRVDSLYFHL